MRFRGRYRGELLPAGTYSITATAIRGSKRAFLGRVRVAIVPLHRDARKAKLQPSRCKALDEPAPTASSASGGLVSFTSEADSSGGSEGTAGATASGSVGEESGARAPRAETSVPSPLPIPFDEAPLWVRTALLGVLAVSIGLLVAAAIPARVILPTAAAAAVAQHRPELAAVGSVLLGIVVVAAVVL